MQITTTTIYHRDGRERTVSLVEAARFAGQGQAVSDGWSLYKPPPPGWEREIPKYRVSRDLEPAQKPRFRLEPPFGTDGDVNVWQYGERSMKAGEIVETRAWPHASFRPLNYSAEKVLSFFNSRQKSRLTNSPWRHGQIRLDDGLSGPVQPLVGPVQPTPFDTSPARARA